MKILFLCVANSARSQMAEALAKATFGNEHSIESAGSVPSGTVNPFAIKAMNEIGIDISSHWSKSVDDLLPSFFIGLDYVVSLCAEEVCPVIASKAKKLRWALPDPASQGNTDAERLQAFRITRNEIKKRIEEFKASVNIQK